MKHDHKYTLSMANSGALNTSISPTCSALLAPINWTPCSFYAHIQLIQKWLKGLRGSRASGDSGVRVKY